MLVCMCYAYMCVLHTYMYVLHIHVCAYVEEMIEAPGITELNHLRQDRIDIIVLRNSVATSAVIVRAV